MARASNYYRTLDLESKIGHEITQSELKQAYKRALLYFHPDKQASSSSAKGRPTGLVPTIDSISEAYKTLADPKLRAEYDRQRKDDEGDTSQRVNTRHTGMETVDLEELEYDDGAEVWSRPCRCGSQPAFVVTEAELEKNVEYGELITGCKGCSLWLKVLFSVAD